MQNLQALLKVLVQSPIDFVLIGGFAVVLHGCNQATRDIDICILYSPEQLFSLGETLKPFHPKYRNHPLQPSFSDISSEAVHSEEIYLTTDIGLLDIITKVEGIGTYYDVLKNSEEISIYGAKCRLISLDALIKSKRALGRHRDLITVAELEMIRKEKQT